MDRLILSMILYQEHVTDITEAIELATNQAFDQIVVKITASEMEHRKINDNQMQHAKFTRCDLILEPYNWVNHVILKLQNSIDCDSLDERVKVHSKQLLQQELNWSKHLKCHPCVLMTLPQNKTTVLAREILLNLKRVGTAMIELPIIDPNYWCDRRKRNGGDRMDETAAFKAAWKRWSNFHINSEFDKTFKVALELSSIEPSSQQLKQWFSEPVNLIIIPSNFFRTTRTTREIYLMPSVQRICVEFLKRNPVNFALKCPSNNFKNAKLYLDAFKKSLAIEKLIYHVCPIRGPIMKIPNKRDDFINHERCHFFMAEMFNGYQQAIQAAINDRTSGEMLNLMICGVNGYELIGEIFNELDKINLFVYEENPMVRETIEKVTDDLNLKLTIITDINMTYYYGKMDIIVSISPELICQNQWLQVNFDHVSKYAGPDVTLIPYQSKLFITPLMSTKIFGEMLEETFAYLHRQSSDARNDELRKQAITISFIRHVCECSDDAELFQFNHSIPSCKTDSMSDKQKKLNFIIEQDCVLTGFGGYFEATLYKDIKISGRGCNDGSKNCIPIMYLPLGRPQVLKVGVRLESEFWLLFNKLKRTFWYEWLVNGPILTRIHNIKGYSGCFDYKFV